MENEQTTKADGMSLDLIKENIERLGQLFPEVVKEGRVDFEALHDLLGNYQEPSEERYCLNWAGKANARREAQKRSSGTLRPCREESKDWDTTQNLYIEGDNLEVLKLLQKSYHGRIKMIYIDPPYNTGKDFVYKDNYKDNLANYLQQIGEDRSLSTKALSDSDGRFHSKWLNMMYPRLRLARNLLTEDGVILVSIGDREVKNLIAIMDEIYGANNQVCCFVWKSRAKPTNAGNARYRPQKVSEYIVAYSRTDPESLLFNVIAAKQRSYPHHDELGEYRTTTILTSNRGTFRRETMRFESHGYTPNEDFRWKAGKGIIDNLYDTNHIIINDEGIPMEKKYKHEEVDPLYPIYTSIISDLSGTAENGKADLSELIGNRHGFDTVKPVMLLKYLIQTFTDQDNCIILDFFAGSSTTAQACIEQNYEDFGTRKVILVQIPEAIPEDSEAREEGYSTICDLGKERIRRVGKKIKDGSPLTTKDLDVGFKVYKLDSSNVNAWDSDPDHLEDALEQSLFNIKAERTEEDLLYEIILKYGMELTVKVNEHEIAGKKVYELEKGELIVCLAPEGLSVELAEGIGQLWDAVKDQGAGGAKCRVVFQETGFYGEKGDEVKSNSLLTLKQHGIENVVTV